MLDRNSTENSVKGAYSKVAWFYDLWSWLTESRSAEKVIEFGEIRDGEHILEVAVGTGLLFARLAARNSTGKTEGIDISPSMLARAQQRMKEFPTARYTMQMGSAYRLPFVSNTFDLLVNNFMLDLMPEKDFAPVLSEFNRVLKPHGRIVLSTMTFGPRWYHQMWHWIARHFPALLTGCRPVLVGEYVSKAGFDSIETVFISQNTFPSQVLRARKQ